jgi:hypothetical protein
MTHEREARLRQAIADDGFACRKVVGMSMAPTLLPGETLFVEPCPDPAPGDIVAFSVAGSLLVHRIVRVDAGTLTCRGDNRLVDDPTVPRAALLGKVVEIAGRGRVPDARRDVAAMRARRTLFRILRRPRRLAGELWLFASQAGLGAGPTPQPGECAFWDPEDSECVGDHVLEPAEGSAAQDREGRIVSSDLPAGAAVVVPAGVYSRLPAEARDDLLRSLAGRTLTVWALPLESFGPLVRLTAALRNVLRRIGLKVGEAGDMYAPPGLGTPGGYCHASSLSELVEALRAAGGDPVAVDRRSVGTVRLLRGRATL